MEIRRGRSQEGKWEGGMKWPREKSRDGHVDLTGEREKMLRLCVHVSGIIGLLPDRLEDISFFLPILHPVNVNLHLFRIVIR